MTFSATALPGVPTTLAPELVRRLGHLADQPEGVAEVAISAMPYGSRAALVAHRIIEPVATVGDSAVEIIITAEGRDIIQSCADHARTDGDADRAKQAEAELRHASDEWRHGRRPTPRPAAIPPIDALSEGTRRRLGALAHQPEGVAEVAISAWDYSCRELLIQHGIICGVQSMTDAAVEIAITPDGWRLIEELAEARDGQRDEQAHRAAEDELSRLRERRGLQHP